MREFKISIRNDGTYLIKECQSRGYEEEMLKNISGKTLIKPVYYYKDNVRYVSYDICKLVSLEEYLNGRELDFGGICSIFLQLNNVCALFRRHLLNERNLRFSPELIFVEPDTDTLRFPAVADENPSIKSDISELTGLIMQKVDLSDNRALRMAFAVYRQTLDEEFSLKSILSEIERIRDMGTDPDTAMRPELSGRADSGNSASETNINTDQAIHIIEDGSTEAETFDWKGIGTGEMPEMSAEKRKGISRYESGVMRPEGIFKKKAAERSRSQMRKPEEMIWLHRGDREQVNKTGSGGGISVGMFMNKAVIIIICSMLGCLAVAFAAVFLIRGISAALRVFPLMIVAAVIAGYFIIRKTTGKDNQEQGYLRKI